MAELVVGIGLLTQGAEQFTGTATYIRELLLELRERNGAVRFEALCNDHALSFFASCASPTVVLKPARDHYAGTSRARRAGSVVRARARPQSLRRQLGDVQVVHYPLTLGVPSVRVPTIVSLHDVQHHDMPEHFSPAVRLWRRMYYDRPARNATLIHTLSRYSKGRIVDALGVSPERVVVIPLAVDHARFRPEAPRDEELLQAMPLPPRFLFYPATLWRHKNHVELLDAMTMVEDDELHLVLCGGSLGRRAEILAAAERRGLAHRVHHFGFISDLALPAVYRRATALVFPSQYEGFGAPTLEAMASGCPVAASSAGPLAEICRDAAIDLTPDDPRQMAAAIDRVAGDTALRAELREAGLTRAREYSWVRVADAHLAAYRLAAET